MPRGFAMAVFANLKTNSTALLLIDERPSHIIADQIIDKCEREGECMHEAISDLTRKEDHLEKPSGDAMGKGGCGVGAERNGVNDAFTK
jgi:hypothetical protein